MIPSEDHDDKAVTDDSHIKAQFMTPLPRDDADFPELQSSSDSDEDAEDDDLFDNVLAGFTANDNIPTGEGQQSSAGQPHDQSEPEDNMAAAGNAGVTMSTGTFTSAQAEALYPRPTAAPRSDTPGPTSHRGHIEQGSSSSASWVPTIPGVRPSRAARSRSRGDDPTAKTDAVTPKVRPTRKKGSPVLLGEMTDNDIPPGKDNPDEPDPKTKRYSIATPPETQGNAPAEKAAVGNADVAKSAGAGPTKNKREKDKANDSDGASPPSKTFRESTEMDADAITNGSQSHSTQAQAHSQAQKYSTHLIQNVSHAERITDLPCMVRTECNGEYKCKVKCKEILCNTWMCLLCRGNCPTCDRGPYCQQHGIPTGHKCKRSGSNGSQSSDGSMKSTKSTTSSVYKRRLAESNQKEADAYHSRDQAAAAHQQEKLALEQELMNARRILEMEQQKARDVIQQSQDRERAASNERDQARVAAEQAANKFAAQMIELKDTKVQTAEAQQIAANLRQTNSWFLCQNG